MQPRSRVSFGSVCLFNLSPFGFPIWLAGWVKPWDPAHRISPPHESHGANCGWTLIPPCIAIASHSPSLQTCKWQWATRCSCSQRNGDKRMGDCARRWFGGCRAPETTGKGWGGHGKPLKEEVDCGIWGKEPHGGGLWEEEMRQVPGVLRVLSVNAWHHCEFSSNLFSSLVQPHLWLLLEKGSVVSQTQALRDFGPGHSTTAVVGSSCGHEPSLCLPVPLPQWQSGCTLGEEAPGLWLS